MEVAEEKRKDWNLLEGEARVMAAASRPPRPPQGTLTTIRHRKTERRRGRGTSDVFLLRPPKPP